ncbi:hypothetical protein TDB9533_03908 [Thalassocella blandensis]|nr:hypothetical protein TDB9533_03908 [Thalassocella blandensis]
MWYKRYGYKQPNDGNGYYAKHMEARFFLVIITFLTSIASMVFSGESYQNLYMFILSLYIVLSFSPEIVAKLKIYPVLVAILTVIILFSIFRMNVFYFSESSGWPDFNETILPDRIGYGIFVFFNIVIFLLFFVSEYWNKLTKLSN